MKYTQVHEKQETLETINNVKIDSELLFLWIEWLLSDNADFRRAKNY